MNNNENTKKTELTFLFVLLAIGFIFVFFIFQPFLYALILAAIMASIAAPFHRLVCRTMRVSGGLGALLSTLLILSIIVAPVTFLGMQVFSEAKDIYTSLTENGGNNDLSASISEALEKLSAIIPVPVEFSTDLSTYISMGLDWMIGHLGYLFSNLADILLGTFIFLIALYYLFKDGDTLKATIRHLSPLQDTYDDLIFNKLDLAVNSVVRGTLIVAFVQGVLTSIGFLIFGVPNAALWGSVAAIAALIPAVGTSLIILPAVLYLFVNGNSVAAIGLAAWGITAVGLIDNFLGPKLVERGVRIHPFLILISILGGISLFGPIGILLGPLALSFVFVLLEIYALIVGKKESGA